MAILPSGVILGRLTSLCQEGPLFSSSLVHSPFRTSFPFPTARSLSLLQPQDAIARLAVVAARTLAVPALTQLWICRVGIWQYKMSLPLLRLATLSATTSSDTRPDRRPAFTLKPIPVFCGRKEAAITLRGFLEQSWLFRPGQLLFHIYIIFHIISPSCFLWRRIIFKFLRYRSGKMNPDFTFFDLIRNIASFKISISCLQRTGYRPSSIYFTI